MNKKQHSNLLGFAECELVSYQEAITEPNSTKGHLRNRNIDDCTKHNRIRGHYIR